MDEMEMEFEFVEKIIGRKLFDWEKNVIRLVKERGEHSKPCYVYLSKSVVETHSLYPYIPSEAILPIDYEEMLNKRFKGVNKDGRSIDITICDEFEVGKNG